MTSGRTRKPPVIVPVPIVNRPDRPELTKKGTPRKLAKPGEGLSPKEKRARGDRNAKGDARTGRTSYQSKKEAIAAGTRVGNHYPTETPVYGKPTDDTDPAEVLLTEIRRTAGHIQWLGVQLGDTDPELFVKSFWLRGRQSGWIGKNEIDQNDSRSAAAIWVELYLAERRHLAAICRTALAAGIEERRVRMAERQAERVADVIIGILYDLGIDPEDERVRVIIYKWLQQAATGNLAQPQAALMPGEMSNRL